MISRNVYGFPFEGEISPEFAPYHDETEFEYALDFAMPYDSPILAALKGIIFGVQQGFEVGGSGKSLDSNFIIIEHENEEYTNYLHLQHRGSLVKVGQEVETGEVIGYTGLSGYMTYPHLHFEVSRFDGDSLITVIPCFKDTKGISYLRSPIKKLKSM